MAIKINYPPKPVLPNVRMYNVPSKSAFLGRFGDFGSARELYFKVANSVWRASDFVTMFTDDNTLVHDYEPVDIEITVKPIAMVEPLPARTTESQDMSMSPFPDKRK